MSLLVEARHRLGDFSVDATFTSDGGVTALFGRSGSGKTSLINIIAGLMKPESGRVVLDGDIIADSERRIFTPVHRRRFGYVFQEARLFPHLSVGSNLAYGRWFAGRSGKAADMARVVDMLGIGHLLERNPSALSGGERQRVAIGRALLAAPACCSWTSRLPRSTMRVRPRSCLISSDCATMRACRSSMSATP